MLEIKEQRTNGAAIRHVERASMCKDDFWVGKSPVQQGQMIYGNQVVVLSVGNVAAACSFENPVAVVIAAALPLFISLKNDPWVLEGGYLSRCLIVTAIADNQEFEVFIALIQPSLDRQGDDTRLPMCGHEHTESWWLDQ